jgi:Flp pilus assembly protein TadG
MLHGGHPSAFLIAIATTLIACLGLVHDGAHMLRTKTQTTTLAHEAARAGAQELDPDGLRAGTVALDRTAARAAAQRHARQGGARADVDVSADTITVTATMTHRPTVLAVIGDVEIASRATATAHTP